MLSIALRSDDVRRALADLPAPLYDVRSLVLPDARDAAVLVPLELRASGPVVHVVERAAGMRDHAGELGFFGGKLDLGETPEQAALREAREEGGLEPQNLELLGRLSPVPVITRRFVLHPFVAAVSRAPRLASSEHVAIFEVALDPWLEGQREVGVTRAPWQGLELTVPHFEIEGRTMYGASAVILFELLSRLAPAPIPTRLVLERPWGARYEREGG